MKRLWAEIVTPAGVKTGDGPVNLTGASVTRLLDGPGSVSIDVPGMDTRARLLLVSQRRVFVYQGAAGDTPRLVAQGIVGQWQKQQNNSGWTLNIDGPDGLAELKDYNTLLNRQYDNEPLADVVESLTALAGWTAEVEDSDITIVARYDGVSVLKALQALQKNNGLHFRLGDTPRELEFGAFGTDAGVTLLNVDTGGADSDDMAIIESISISEESENLYNWILPIGSGEGEAAITLAKSTRSFVQGTVGPDDEPLYYVADEDSIAAYGTKQRVVQFKDIAPLSNSEAAKVEAANALADAAYADLQWNKDPQRTYSVILRKCRRTLKPGDTVRLIYSGPMRFDNGSTVRELPDERIDGTFYITKVTERLTPEVSAVSLEISNINRRQPDEATTLMNSIEAIEQKNLRPQRIQQTFVYHYKDNYSALSGATSYFEIPITENQISELLQVKLRVRLIPAGFTGYMDNAGGDFQSSFYFTRSLRYAKCTIQIGYQPDLQVYAPVMERTLATAVTDPDTGFYEEYDVTDDFLNSAGGLYNTHVIQFDGVEETLTDAGDTLAVRITSILPADAAPPASVDFSTGVVSADLIIVAIVQSIAPS